MTCRVERHEGRQKPALETLARNGCVPQEKSAKLRSPARFGRSIPLTDAAAHQRETPRDRGGPTVIEPGSSYVALGSSFASGPKIPRRVAGSPRAAGRSDHNYAHLVAGALDLALTDVTFSGAVTADLLHPNQLGYPAQLEALTPTTRLVTLTCGGNDLAYIPYLVATSIPRPLRMLPGGRTLTAALDTTQLDEHAEALGENLQLICARIRQRAPHARVLFTDYPALVPPATDASPAPFTDATASDARRIADTLSTVVERHARENRFEFVPAAQASRDHHAWAEVPWTSRMTLMPWAAAPYHPNAAGMRAVADMILAQLGASAQ